MRSYFGLLVAVAFISQAVATPTRPVGLDLRPRASPQPCTQQYICPQPSPYNPIQYPDLGDNPSITQFKCRIGWSSSDPNFAFCIYEKNTGNLIAATPSSIKDLCWGRAMANPDCQAPTRRRALPVRPRVPEPMQAASPVVMERFSKAKRD